MKHVLLVGATSRLGSEVLPVLLRAGHRVRALVRRPDAALPDGVERVVGDLQVPQSLPAACRDIDVVVHVAGAPLTAAWSSGSTFESVDHLGTRALALAASTADVGRIVYLSVAGDFPRGLGYVDAHRRAEAALAEVGIPASVVRATGFHGLLTRLVDVARLGVIPVPGSGAPRTNPIAETDLGRILVEQIEASPATIEVGGPEVLTRREIAECAFAALGRSPRILAVPTGSLNAGAFALSWFDERLSDIAAFVAHLHVHDSVAPAVGHVRLIDSFRAYVESP